MKKDCVASVAFIKSDKNLCYIHGHDTEHEESSEEEHEESPKECINDILLKTVAEEVDCFFWLLKKPFFYI